MSISSRGVKIQKRGRNYWVLIILTFVELVFSFLLVVSLASNLLFPQRASAVAGVSAKLSYQGRLTDLSGNPLGGTGTNYCFRFSIYDAATAGTKVWPAGAPASTTVRVKDGVFNTELGTADSIATFDFSANDTIYLNVEVNATATTCGGAWEQLDLRQRIDSVGYARSAEGVYSGLLRAPTGGTAVQIGTGAGAATPIFLNLDVKNTQEAVDASCTTNGQIWYNSADSRARVCQGSVIRDMIDGLLVKDEGVDRGRASTALDFTGAGVVASKGAGGVININIPFSGVAVNAAGTVSSGVVVFSNSNNVTFGLVGSTITASITAAGGGGGATISHWPPFPIGIATSSNYTGATAAGTNITASFHVFPLQLEQALAFSRINILASYVTTIAGTGSVSLAHMLGIYTLNAGTALSLSTSYMFRQEITQNSITAGTYRWYWGTNSTSNSSSTSGNVGSLFNSFRVIPLFDLVASNSLSAGQYFLAYAQTNRSSSVNVKPAATIMYVSESQSALGALGQLGSAVTRAPFPLLGQFSSTTTAGNFTTPFMPTSINTTAITNTGGSSQWKWPYVMFVGK